MKRSLLILGLTFTLLKTTEAVTKWNSGDGTIYKLKVTQDVTLERNNNYNSLQYLLLARHPQFPLKRSLIQFESLPKSCPPHKIRWANMYLYFVYAHKASWHSVSKAPYLSHTINIHRVKRSWRENQATVSRRYSGSNWYARYLELNRDAVARPVSSKALYALRPKGFMEFDVSQAVMDWRNGSPNYGLLLKVKDEKRLGRDLRFYSNNFSDRSKHGFINVMCG